MRRAVNENPIIQVVVIGILVLVVGFMLVNGVFSRGEPEPAATDATPAGGAVATGPGATPEATEALEPAATEGAAAPEGSLAEPAPAGFAAGPGLPAPVVAAYERGDTVVLLVTRRTGIEDRRMRSAVDSLAGRGDIAVFKTVAKHVAEYSRIAQGVDLDRVPALIALSPRDASDGPMPAAAVSYGYRGLESVEQAIRDAGYDGPALPYHPR